MCVGRVGEEETAYSLYPYPLHTYCSPQKHLLLNHLPRRQGRESTSLKHKNTWDLLLGLEWGCLNIGYLLQLWKEEAWKDKF